MSGLDLLVLVLGSYRLWMLVAKDTITEPIRQRVLGYSLGADGKYHRNRWPKARKKTGEFVHCPWCAGWWISLAATLAYYEWPHATRLVLAPFAISAGLAIVAVTFDRLVLDRD